MIEQLLTSMLNCSESQLGIELAIIYLHCVGFAGTDGFGVFVVLSIHTVE